MSSVCRGTRVCSRVASGCGQSSSALTAELESEHFSASLFPPSWPGDGGAALDTVPVLLCVSACSEHGPLMPVRQGRRFKQHQRQHSVARPRLQPEGMPAPTASPPVSCVCHSNTHWIPRT